MKTSYFYGWIPDVPDQRDYFYTVIRPVVKIPQRVDLRRFCSIVENQGQLGSCTANALAGNLEFLDNQSDQDYTDVSRLFVYYNERMDRGTVDYNSGAMLRDGIKVLAKFGACSEKIWPYDIEKFTKKPMASCYKQALEHQIVSYHRLQTINDMLVCLSEGSPFVFGFTVYESFESPQVAKTGLVPIVGGH